MTLVIGAILVVVGVTAFWEFFEGVTLAGEYEWDALIASVLYFGFGIFLIV